MKKDKKKFWIPLAAIVLLVAGSLGYVLTGQQWPVGTVIVYSINPNTTQVPDEDSAVKNAANSWSQIFPAGLKFSYAGYTSATTYGRNYNNTVCWKDEGNNGTLASAYWWYSIPDNTTVEADLVFNDWYGWHTSGDQYDIQTVALHEFGHWIGLDHSTTGIMKASYSGLQRTIDADARAGFLDLYWFAQEESPSIQLDRASLSFIGSAGYANPLPQQFMVRNSGGLTLNFQVQTNRPWIQVSPAYGSSTGQWREVVVTVDISGLSIGSHSGTISVTSADADNSPQNLAVILDVVNDKPPSVSITSPQDGAVLSKIVTVRAQASDDKGVQRVEFYLDGKMETTDRQAPFEWRWDTAAFPSGKHAVSARAHDTIGLTAEDSITVKVDQPPSVSFLNPAAGSEVMGVVPLSVSAKDDFGVRRVLFYVDDVIRSTDRERPFRYDWDTASASNGEYRLKAVCFDTYAQAAQAEIPVFLIPHPPLNFTGIKEDNSSVLLEQYVVFLSWETNVLNQDIRWYRIYRVEADKETLLDEIEAGTFSYIHRDIDKDKAYTYALRAVDIGGREGEASYTEIR